MLKGQDQLEGMAAKLLIAPARVRFFNRLLIHGRLHRVRHFLLGLEAHRVHDQIGDLIVFSHDQHDLVIAFRPSAVEHIVLRLQKRGDPRPVLVRQQLLPDVHGGIIAAELRKITAVIAAVHTAHHVLQQLHHVGLDNIVVCVLCVDRQRQVIGILDRGQILMNFAVRVIQIALERFQIVCLRAVLVQALHQVVHDV